MPYVEYLEKFWSDALTAVDKRVGSARRAVVSAAGIARSEMEGAYWGSRRAEVPDIDKVNAQQLRNERIVAKLLTCQDKTGSHQFVVGLPRPFGQKTYHQGAKALAFGAASRKC